MAQFLEYSNMTQSNIIPKDEFEPFVLETFNIIAANLSKSLGPLGSSATILDGMMTEATKDGYAILNKYCFHNRYRKMIYNLIKAPCTRMNNTVGDGTTTAIALTSALFQEYQASKTMLDTLYRLPRNLVQVWDACIHDICELVQEKATPVDPKDYKTIYNLAYVTSNGNSEISKTIANVYKEAGSPAIKMKDSPTNMTYMEAIDGFDFPANLIDRVWCKNEDTSSTETDIYVMIFDRKVDNDIFTSIIKPINDVCRAMGHRLLVLAPSFDMVMCNTVLEQYLKMEARVHSTYNIIMAAYTQGKLAPHQLEDLATILRGKVITETLQAVISEEMRSGNIDTVVDHILNDDQSPVYRLIGHADHVLLSALNGSVFKVKDIEEDERYKINLKQAEDELEAAMGEVSMERQSYAHKIYDARARVLQLKMKNYIYYIGADSELQKQIIHDAVDDVIKCLRSAIKYGVVPGCQLTILQACNELIKKTSEPYLKKGSKDKGDVLDAPDHVKLRVQILSMIYAAVVNVYTRVLHGPDNSGMVKLIDRWQYTENTPEAMEALGNAAIKKGQEIINKSIKTNTVFDMETLKFNKGIITSAQTDMMVLSAASDLVKVLISGNQCIFRDADIDECHEEIREVYV